MELAVDWLIHSRIHNLSPTNKETFGSYNNYYDTLRKTCPCAHTEITGYSIEMLLDLYERTNDPAYLEYAESAAKWIIGMQYEGKDENAAGSFLKGLSLAEMQKSRRAYSFDAGICIGALVELYRKTTDPLLLEAATRGARWLMATMQNSDGSLRPFYDLEKGFSTPEKWYLPKHLRARFSWFEKPGSYHVKAVIGLLKLHSVTREDRYENASRELCEWTLSQQKEGGVFPACSQNNSVFAHTQCYAIEGLMYASEYLNSERFFSAARKGVLQILKAQEMYGRIPDWLHGETPSSSVDSSSLAQALRILTILKGSNRNSSPYNGNTRQIMENLLLMQCTDSRDYHALGGFYLTEYDAKLMRIRLPRVYSWPTMFALHAVTLLLDEKNSGPLQLW